MILQVDPKVSLGNIITIGTIVFGMGGAWWSIKEGQKTTNDRLDALKTEIGAIHKDYLTKELDAEKEKFLLAKITELADKIKAIEERQGKRTK